MHKEKKKNLNIPIPTKIDKHINAYIPTHS